MGSSRGSPSLLPEPASSSLRDSASWWWCVVTGGSATGSQTMLLGSKERDWGCSSVSSVKYFQVGCSVAGSWTSPRHEVGSLWSSSLGYTVFFKHAGGFAPKPNTTTKPGEGDSPHKVTQIFSKSKLEHPFWNIFLVYPMWSTSCWIKIGIVVTRLQVHRHFKWTIWEYHCIFL